MLGSEVMTEEIASNLYRVEIPFPNNPLNSLNSYVIKASDRNLIIDAGMNREECLNSMRAGLRNLGGFKKNRLLHYSFSYRSYWPRFETKNR